MHHLDIAFSLDCFHLFFQRSFAWNFTKVLQKVCPASWQIMNHEVYLQKCKNKYPFNMGKSQLTSASLCEHVSLLRASLLTSYLQSWPTPENRQDPWTVQLSVLQLCKFRIRLRLLSHIQLSPLGLVHRAHVVSKAQCYCNLKCVSPSGQKKIKPPFLLLAARALQH